MDFYAKIAAENSCFKLPKDNALKNMHRIFFAYYLYAIGKIQMRKPSFTDWQILYFTLNKAYVHTQMLKAHYVTVLSMLCVGVTNALFLSSKFASTHSHGLSGSANN